MGKENDKDVKAIWLDNVRETKSKGTFKSYRNGFAKFEEYLGESANAILEQRRKDMQSKDPLDTRRFNDLVNKFYEWLQKPIHTIGDKEKQSYGINTARTLGIAVAQFFSFWAVPVKVRFHTVKTGKTAFPTIDEWRKIWTIADLRGKTAISLGLDFAWRIGDFQAIKIADLGDLSQECPIQIEKLTEKEKELSSTFISCETVELLKVYLPTLREDNEYLFQTRSNGSHIDDETLNGMLQELGFKSGLTDKDGIFLNGRNKGKRLSWHSFRKTFLTTATNLEIDPDTKCLLVGKSIEKGESMETYLGDIHLREAFLTVRNALALNKTQQVERQADEIAELKATITAQSQTIMNQQTEIRVLNEKLASLEFGQKTQQKMIMDMDNDLAEIKTKLGIKEKKRTYD
jgi:integrase/uncharacterized coiled-coil protein SlyX